ncbi:MAG: aspartate-semialdehyde dehydrogenase [Spirochaetes bacterium GWF1_51_8]|nr:MAG: aspartate-semialdehyde dehydrogenase [Spirochaetes bacterium GWF1_51_8]
MSGKVVAVVGATGAVGREMIRTLERRNFPVKQIRFFASSRSAGQHLKFNGDDVVVEELTEKAFDNQGIEIALFSAGGDTSKQFSPIVAKAGAVVIDNSSAWRMNPEVPLVVPEVNPEDVKFHKGIIANPNCSTIQMVVALKPLHDYSRVLRIIVSTYQSVSGAGQRGIDELWDQTKNIINGKPIVSAKFPKQIAFNVIPQIDVFLENHFTKEEMKMVNETRKIMHDEHIATTATCVRVPVLRGHSESVYIETEKKISRDKALELFSKAPGIVLMDDPSTGKYPVPTESADQFDTYVGRVREDLNIENGLNFWCVSDNLLKGAASNAVQIAEIL